MIRFLLDDPVYNVRYLEYMNDTLNSAFNPEILEKEIDELESLIAPYVTGNNNAADFQSAVNQLIERIHTQYQVAEAFLAGENE